MTVAHATRIEVSPPEAILVAVDFSSASLRALATALRWHPNADVTVVHVLDVDLARRLEDTGVCSAAEGLKRMRARAESEIAGLAPASAFESMVVEGIPFAEIIKIASDLECDLIVLGSQGSQAGLQEFLFGSTAEKVLRAARCPVLCVP